MKSKSRLISLLLTFLMTFTSINVVSAYSESTPASTSLGDAKNMLDNYITSEYPNITIGSEEYYSYLMDQLTIGSDNSLANKPWYNEAMVYANEYVAKVNDTVGSDDQHDEESAVVFSDAALSMPTHSIVSKNELANAKEQKNIGEVTGVSPFAAYSPSKAASYGVNWALTYNTPNFPKYSSDCTNFVSQCVNAGGKSFKYHPNYKNLSAVYSTTSYWYSYHYLSWQPLHQYKESTSFIRVNDFYTYWKNHGASIIECATVSTLQKKVKVGDIVQLRNVSGSWYHSVIITSGSNGNFKYSAHSNNRKNESVNKLSSGNYFRIIRIK